MMTYQFRPFSGDDEYEALVAIHNICKPDSPDRVEDAKRYDGTRNPDHLFNRYVCRHDGQIVGTGSFMLIHWFPTPDQFGVDWTILPAHEEAAGPLFLDFLKAQIVATHNPQAFMAVTLDNQPLRINALETAGFKVTLRSPRSELDVPPFDVAQYALLRANLEADGIELVTLTAYKERDENWMATYRDDLAEMEKDMATSETFETPPLAEFAKQFDEPNHNANAHIFALKEEEIVGISCAWVNPTTKELDTDFTGVKRAYRRKGIATALKVEIIKFAQAYGTKTIKTENQDKTPMHTLNLQMGFRPLPAELEYKLIV